MQVLFFVTNDIFAAASRFMKAFIVAAKKSSILVLIKNQAVAFNHHR
jgi:hypothetical protein